MRNVRAEWDPVTGTTITSSHAPLEGRQTWVTVKYCVDPVTAGKLAQMIYRLLQRAGVYGVSISVLSKDAGGGDE